MPEHWICDIHGEHGESGFHPIQCSGCYEIYMEELFWKDFHRWRELMHPLDANSNLSGKFHPMIGHGYL